MYSFGREGKLRGRVSSVRVRLSVDEMATLAAAAARSGIPPAAYLSQTCLGVAQLRKTGHPRQTRARRRR
jgi:hypothetical protein